MIPAQGNEKDILPAGYVLNHRYRIEKKLGRGGFGVTYSTYDMHSHKRVAVKELYPQQLASRNLKTKRLEPLDGYADIFREYQAKFRREAEMIASFRDYPDVVGIYNLFQENGTQYYAMQLLEGESLRDYMIRSGKLQWNQMNAILSDVLHTLALMHRKGVIHRDIKPDNIYLTSSGKIYLIDFGSARSFINPDGFTEMISPGFAPPEQSERHSDQQAFTDIYAICATIYYCLSGKVAPPGFERSVMSKMEHRDPMLPLETLAPQVPPYVAAAVRKGMSLDPHQRFQSVEELTSALQLGRVVVSKVSKMPKAVRTLICVSGMKRGTQIPLSSDKQVKIGRIPGCDIRYPESASQKGISHLHCIIFCDKSGRVWIQDVSTNGVYVNRQRLSKNKMVQLFPGQVFSFSSERFVVR